MGFVTVPGSIKQQYLPFLLNPDSGYGKIVDSSEAVTCGA